MHRRFLALLIVAGIITLFPPEVCQAMSQTPDNTTYRRSPESSAPSNFRKRSSARSQRVKKNRGTSKTGVYAPAAQPDAKGKSSVQPETGQADGSIATSTDVSAAEAKRTLSSDEKLFVSKDSVSFFFDDVDIFEVVQSVFGEVLKVNYVIDPRVKGRVNFRTVAPVPKSEVLSVMEIILRLNGVGFVQEKGLYRILPLDLVSGELMYAQAGKEPDKVAMELFTFKNLNIKDSLENIENAIGLSANSGKVRVLPIERLNGILVVASTSSQLDYIRRWVETFDTIFDGTRPEVFVYPVQNSNAKDVAGMLQQIFLGGRQQSKTAGKSSGVLQKRTGVKVSASKKIPVVSSVLSGGESLVSDITRIFPDEIANTIIIYATPRDYELISRTITKIDTVPRQVMIEAMIAEVRLVDNLKFGVEWFLKSGFAFENTPLSGITSLGSQALSFDPATPLGLSGFSFAAIDSANLIRGLLQTLAKESNVKVLASPHILASDNREAKIQVGKQVPVQTSTSVTSGGETVTSIQYRDTGIVLTVTPHINEGGLVSLEISQEVSSVDPDAGVGGNPIISNRKAETSVVIQSGQTVVIGGLIQEDKSTVREGVPLLKDIPLLGYLFGYTSQSKDRTELIVMITPKVVTSVSEAKTMTDEFRKKMEGLDDLPGADAEKVPAGEITDTKEKNTL